MIPAMPRRLRYGSVLLLATLVAGSLAGCGVTVNPNPADSSPSATGAATGAPQPTPTGPATSPSAAAPTLTAAVYPATARPYAEAVLAAWKQKQINRIGDLATALVQDQIISIPGLPNQDWAHDRCDGAAGSTYCVFTNADGDVITLRLTNSLLGRAHATTEVKLDQTVYSLDVKQYVQAFVEAWRNTNTKRMLALSSQSGVEFFSHHSPPSTYQVCAKLFGTSWRARVFNGDGVNYRVIIADGARGKPHAITSPIIGQLPPECT